MKRGTRVIKIRYKRKRKSWISQGLVKSIENRDKMYQMLLNQPNNTELKNEYKNYRNKVNSLIKKTKTKFLSIKIRKEWKQ